MENYIINQCGKSVMHINKSIAEKLNRIVPKGCPFENYTFLDLLKDYVYQYDWCVHGKISIVDFLKMISYKSFNCYIYGKTIIEIIEEEAAV